MKKTLIISGGNVNLEFAAKYCEKEQFDYFIVADNGLKVAEDIGITPDYIVGDFDSISPLILYKYENRNDVSIRRFMPEKDFTDTYAAIDIAIEGGSFSIHILGGTGSRLDHTIANILMLQMALEKGVEAIIVSENNRIRLLGRKCRRIIIKKENYKYVSLIPFTPVVTNITTVGMKYNIEKYNMYVDKEISRGVSNEILGSEGEISIDEGTLIVIESND